MKEDEKKPLSWAAADPKPPVIQSGRLEGKVPQCAHWGG